MNIINNLNTSQSDGNWFKLIEIHVMKAYYNYTLHFL